MEFDFLDLLLIFATTLLLLKSISFLIFATLNKKPVKIGIFYFMLFSLFLILYHFLASNYVYKIGIGNDQGETLALPMIFISCLYLLFFIDCVAFSEKELPSLRLIDKIRKKKLKKSLSICGFLILVLFFFFFCYYFHILGSILPLFVIFRLSCFMIFFCMIFIEIQRLEENLTKRIRSIFSWVIVSFIGAAVTLLGELPLFLEMEGTEYFLYVTAVLKVLEIFSLLFLLLDSQLNGAFYDR